jgi:hypothetical protein
VEVDRAAAGVDAEGDDKAVVLTQHKQQQRKN